MRFNRVWFGAVWLMFLGCADENERGIPLAPSPMEIEEVIQAMSQINYVVPLANGETIDFRPSDHITRPAGHHYASVEGPNFTSLAPIIELDQTPEGELDLYYKRADDRQVKFQYVLLSTLGEMAYRYPQFFRADETNEDWLFVVALSRGDMDFHEIIGTYSTVKGITDYLEMVIDPDDIRLSRTFFYDLEYDEAFFLDGIHDLGITGIKSSGSLYSYDQNEQNSISYTFEGFYDLVINRL